MSIIQELVDEFRENALDDVADQLIENGVTRTIEYVETEIAEAQENPGSFLSGDPHNLSVALDRLNGALEDERSEALSEAAGVLTDALVTLYDLCDGDELAVGEVEYECHKAARLRRHGD